MKLKRVLLAAKTITDGGAWKSGVKMPKTAFPLTRSASFKVTAPFNWRLVRFDALGEKFRVLIYYRLDLNRYSALLGREVGGDMLILARFEFHGTHPGWHCHALCDSTGATPGRSGGSDRRVPRAHGFHKQSVYGVANDRAAYDKAVKFFRLDKKPLQSQMGLI